MKIASLNYDDDDRQDYLEESTISQRWGKSGSGTIVATNKTPKQKVARGYIDSALASVFKATLYRYWSSGLTKESDTMAGPET